MLPGAGSPSLSVDQSSATQVVTEQTLLVHIEVIGEDGEKLPKLLAEQSPRRLVGKSSALAVVTDWLAGER